MDAEKDRPYRSHLRPACTQCRRRKSRCSVEARAKVCLMCQAHGTECTFPNGNGAENGADAKPSSPTRKRVKRASAPAGARAGQMSEAPPPPPTPVAAAPTVNHQRHPAVGLGKRPVPAGSPILSSGGRVPSSMASAQEQEQAMPIQLHRAEEDDENGLHIIGPAVTSDSHVLADYLSNVRNGTRTMPMIRPLLGGDTEPVIFTKVLKRPGGVTINPTPPSVQLQMIEKLLEPWTERVVDLYFAKSNVCFPLLDEISFRNQHRDARDQISPALLSNLYAQALCYWSHDPHLSSQRCPDVYFIWDLACQVLFAELRHSPGISTIPAVLLNVGGRPTTSMIGNGVQLGSALSLSLSLGLNRNPLSWQIPQSEKHLRMKIWWCLLVHDRWSSLAYGTPPRLRKDQYDVPPPTEEYLLGPNDTRMDHKAASVFIALVGLTEVFEAFLDHVYCVRRDLLGFSVSDLDVGLNSWVDSLTDDVRKIVIRGTDELNTPGASNLRLAFLATRMLLRRIELNRDRDAAGSDPQKLNNRYMQIRRTAEDIVHLVQELNRTQLADFWLPVAAFTFSHTVTFLIRCALETENTPVGLSQSPSLKMANELLAALRSHQERWGWDLADICLAQHAEVLEKLMTQNPSDDHLAPAFLESQHDSMADFPFMDDWLAYTNFDFLPG